MAPRVLVAILGYASADDAVETARVLSGLTYRPFDLLLVDNGSPDRFAATVAHRCPWLAIERNEANLGFAGGMNSILRRAADRGYAYALLCNQDVSVAPDALGHLVETAEALPQAALVGGLAAQYKSGDVVAVGGEAFSLIRGRVTWSSTIPEAAGAKRVPFVQGACMLYRVSAYQQGLSMDDDLFMYFEEADLAMKLRRMRLEAYVDPRVVVRHKGEDRFMVPRNAYLQQRNRVHLARTHGSSLQAALHMAYVGLLELPIKVVVRTLQGHPDFAHALVRGFVDGIRGRMGPGAVEEFRA